MCPIHTNNIFAFVFFFSCIFKCINENCGLDGLYSAAGVIDGASMAFQNILSAFPPCWIATQQTYQQIFVGPISKDGFLANGIIYALQTPQTGPK